MRDYRLKGEEQSIINCMEIRGDTLFYLPFYAFTEWLFATVYTQGWRFVTTIYNNMWLSHWLLLRETDILPKAWSNITYGNSFFTHLKFCLAAATQNFKRVKKT